MKNKNVKRFKPYALEGIRSSVTNATPRWINIYHRVTTNFD